MSHFNQLFIRVLFLLAFSILAHAAETKQVASSSANIFSISYFSWTEKVLLDQGPISDNTRAQFSGTGLHFERASSWSRWAISPELSFLTGAAAAGGTSSILSYSPPRTSFVGLHFQIKSDFRFSPRVLFSIGPGVLYRKISFENTNAAMSVTSGSDFNTTVLGELKIRLNSNWDLRQQLGAVLFNAYAYWGLGLGYRF